MSEYIKDNSNKKIVKEKYIEDYINNFGEEPYIIGMFWNTPEIVIENVKKAIEENKPYDEYELLTKEEQKAFDDGKLLF